MDDQAPNCEWCEEPVTAAEQSPTRLNGRPVHVECAFRMLGGSLAHVVRRCSCYVPGSQLTDPPMMTRRSAAKVAYATHQLLDQVLDPDAFTVASEVSECPLRRQ